MENLTGYDMLTIALAMMRVHHARFEMLSIFLASDDERAQAQVTSAALNMASVIAEHTAKAEQPMSDADAATLALKVLEDVNDPYTVEMSAQIHRFAPGF